MTAIEPERIWWTADEIAGARLPGLAGSKRGVNLFVQREGWQTHPEKCRRRKGRGGGWEYHWTLFPKQAAAALLTAAKTEPHRADRGEAWAAFDRLPEATKTQARQRLKAVRTYEGLRSFGATASAAAAQAAREAGVGARTIFNWLEMVEGIPGADRLPYLAPRHRLADRKTNVEEAQPFMDWLKGLFLRQEEPTFEHCYRETVKQAKRQGWTILKDRTARRRLEKQVPRVTRVFARQGLPGLMKCFPPQIRDRRQLTAMELVNADCHKIDVFVEWPDGTIDRPQIVAFQDVYSGKILCWRIDHTPNKVMVMSAFGEMVERWGIPRGILFDNGREFANKWMTGGAPTRFRFKIVEDEPLGVLPLLDIDLTWATPGHGQAKPIERAFRDVASDVAKDIRFHGAYVGNKPDAKPANYRERAVPLDTFLRVLDEGINEHNARDGRLSQTAEGRSFDATFAESYAATPIRKATEEQRRLWLTAQHVGKLNRDNGQLRVHGNFYYSEWMTEVAGQNVVARFDPEDLHAGVYVYDTKGAYLGFAECRQAVGFRDMVEAKALQRRKARIKRAEKELLKAHRPVSIEEIAAQSEAVAPEPEQPLEAKVVSGMFKHRTHTELRAEALTPDHDPALEAARDELIKNNVVSIPEREAKDNRWRAPQDPESRWDLMIDLEFRSLNGQPIGREEARFFETYRESIEYQTRVAMGATLNKDDTG